MFLAGDIGGTNTRVAFFEGDPGHLKTVAVKIYPSAGHSGPEDMIRLFLDEFKYPIESACFGIAGPIRDGRVETPNLPWVVESKRMAEALKVDSVQLLNDLEANAHGIAALQDSDMVTLAVGSPSPEGNRGLISAGTGLGMAGLLYSPAVGTTHASDIYRPFPSEGGHVDFGPRNKLEIQLLEHLLKKYDHVSWERVLSGPGLQNIYQFLRDAGKAEEPQWLAQQVAAEGTAAISRAGLEGTAPIAVTALDMFTSIYGAAAGNLALSVVATNGLFVGGGIAPRILKKLQDTIFMKAFLAKGRVGSFLAAVPVRVITNDMTALLGAGRCAALAAARKQARGA
jgi:glucokinase